MRLYSPPEAYSLSVTLTSRDHERVSQLGRILTGHDLPLRTRIAAAEWLTRPYNIFEPDQVEMCRQAFSNLLSASATRDEARQLITSAASSLRERQG